MKIYQILPDLYLGEVLEVPDDTMGIPIGWTRTAVDVPEGNYAVWGGTEWVITNIAPPIEESPVINWNITINAFLDRLGSQKFDILLSENEQIKDVINNVKSIGYINLQSVLALEYLNTIKNNGFEIDTQSIISIPPAPQENYIFTPQISPIPPEPVV